MIQAQSDITFILSSQNTESRNITKQDVSTELPLSYLPLLLVTSKKRSGIMTDLLHSQFKKKPEETVSNRESSADKCLWIAC